MHSSLHPAARYPAALLVSLAVIVAGACGSSTAVPAGSSERTATAIATSAATGTPATTTPTTAATATQAPPGTATTAAGGFDAERAYAHVVELATSIGKRLAGSEGEARAAEYLADQLRSYGYDVTIEPFSFEGFVNYGATLSDDAGQEFTPTTLYLSGAGDVRGRVVFAGLGGPGDFPSDTSGAIALIQRGVIKFQEKVANAAAAGAVGVVIYNNEAGEFRGNLESPSTIPAVSLSAAEGGRIREYRGQLHLQVDTFNGRVDSHNVVARPHGGSCEILAGGHFDSVPAGPGANDNASGSATVVELARVISGSPVAGRVCFATFGAEELGLHGSKAFVASLDTADRLALRAMLNFDMVGVGGTWSVIGSPQLVQMALGQAKDLGIPAAASEIPANTGSDHASFLEAGVPVLFFFGGLDTNYHLPTDLAGAVSPAKMAEAGAMGLAVIAELLRT